MKCQEVRSLFSEYYDQELNREIKGSLKKHLALCQECSAEYESFKKALKVLTKLKTVEPKRDYSIKRQS